MALVMFSVEQKEPELTHPIYVGNVPWFCGPQTSEHWRGVEQLAHRLSDELFSGSECIPFTVREYFVLRAYGWLSVRPTTEQEPKHIVFAGVRFLALDTLNMDDFETLNDPQQAIQFEGTVL